MPNESFFEPETISKLLKGAKDEPVAFAFGQAGSADANLLAVDRKKSAEQLFAAIKKAGISKGFWGTARFDGSKAVFASAKPASGQQKLLEEWFRRNKVSIKPVTDDGEAAPVESETPAEPRPAATADRAGDEDEEANEEPQDEEAEVEEEEEEADEDDETLLAKIFQQATVRKALEKARKRPCFFAFGVGQGESRDLLALHLRRPGDKLARLVKEANKATRGSFGTVRVERGTAVFRCERDPLAGLRKRILALFKEWDLSLKVSVLGPTGEAEDAEVEDGAEDGADALATLRAGLGALLPRLKEVFAAVPDRAEEIRARYKECDDAIDGGDAATARRLLGELRELAELGGPTVGRVAALRAEMDGLLPTLKEIAKDPARTDAVRAAWRDADAALDAGDADAAATAVAALRTIVSGRSAGASGARPWLDARDAWRAAIERVDGQIAALQAVLKGSDNEELHRVAEYGLNGITGDHKVPLTVALLELEAAPGEAAAARKALEAASAFRRHIETDARVEACDDNPFGVTVAIRATLGAALSGLEAALAEAA